MYRTVTDTGAVREYLDRQPVTRAGRVVAFDIETAPDEPFRLVERAALDPHKAHIVGISFSVDEGSGIYVPLTHRKGENAKQSEMLALLAEFAADPSVTKVAHNLAFESMFFYAQGIIIQPPVYDTIAAAQLTFEAAQHIREERAAHFKAHDNSGNTYPFSSIILCECCGKKYKRKKAAAGFVWQCSTFLQRGKSVCPAKQIPEGTLAAVAAEVLGLAEFNGTVFQKQITEIRVPGANRLAFVFSDGNTVHREWQDRSQSESWTKEKRQAAREHALRRHGGGASQ